MQAPIESKAITLRGLLTLAWPIVISRASQTVVGLCDALMVADLGSAALGATGTGAFNVFTLLILPMGVTFIVSSFSSQHFGRGELAAARRYGWYGLAVAVVAQVLSLAGIAAVPWVLSKLPYESDVRSLMTQYMQVRLLTAGCAIGIEALANYYGGLGRTRPAMVANVVAMVLNVALCWVLIYGHLGFAPMGVVGSAAAAAIATAIAFIGIFIYFVLDGRTVAKSPLSLREFGRMLRFGLPSGFNWLIEFLAFVVFMNVAVTKLGTAAVASLNAVFQLNSAAFMPAFALASAGAIHVGQAIGNKSKDLVPGIVKLTQRAAVVWQGTVGLLYVAVPALFIAPFAKGDDAAVVMLVGVHMLRISAAWQIFDATANVYAEALRASGDTLFPMVARTAIAWLVFIPGAMVSVYYLGFSEVGVTFWLVLYLALLAGLSVWRFRTGKWRTMELVEPTALVPVDAPQPAATL